MHRLLAFMLVAAFLAGCNPCAERCRVQAKSYDDCLFDWGLEWADLDAEDADDFRTSCISAEAVLDAGLSADERQLERGLCSDLNADLRAAATCDDSWQALIDYGEQP